MNIKEDVSLANYTTMRLGGQARYLCDIHSLSDIPTALDWAKVKKLPVRMIGGGSNIFWSDEGFDGLVMVNKIKGFSIAKEDDTYSYVTMGAGEDWDECVKETVDAKLSGIEALSLIPGTVGGTPIQNVGAYGQEISDTLISVKAYDSVTKTFVTILNEYCGFGYRTSRFKTKDKGRFFIASLQFRLTTNLPQPPFYPAIQKYLDEKHSKTISARTIRDAVIAIRSAKLPDQSKIANNGSFFANPIITIDHYKKLQKSFPTIPGWKIDDNMKLSAAWLIEQAGFKEYKDEETGMSTWHLQPLVIVNDHAKSTKDVLDFRDKIVKKIKQKFDIDLLQEPEYITTH